MEKIIKIEVSEQEFNLIMGALSEVPYKASAPLLNKLHQQFIKPLEVAEESK